MPTTEECTAEPILIFDDESEGIATSSASNPIPLSGAEPCLEIPPIAVLGPGLEPVSSDSLSIQARVEEFENAVKQIISLVSLSMGTYDGFKQSLLDRMADLRWLGERRLATHCV